MLHSEYLRNASETYEVRHNNNEVGIHAYITNNEAIIFPSLVDFVNYVFLGVNDVERFYCSTSILWELYESNEYSYESLKKLAEKYQYNKF